MHMERMGMSEFLNNAKQALWDISLLKPDDFNSTPFNVKDYLYQVLDSDSRCDFLLAPREEAIESIAQDLSLNRLNYETILHLFRKLQHRIQSRKYDPEYDFPATQLYRTKSLDLTKAILLVSYRYNLGAKEIGDLRYSCLSGVDERAPFMIRSKCSERPLHDLEAPYYEALDVWGRLLNCEDRRLLYYFGEIRRGDNVLTSSLSRSYYLELVVNYLL